MTSAGLRYYFSVLENRMKIGYRRIGDWKGGNEKVKPALSNYESPTPEAF